MRKTLLSFLLLACTAALADEAGVKILMESKFQGAKVSGVSKTAYGGLYEVYVDGQIGYTDEKVTFFIVGNLIDTKTSLNVTQQRLRKLTAINIKEIPLELGIRKVLGNGKRQLIVFSDPMCPFCRQLEQELLRMSNITVYIMLYPIEAKFKGTTELARQIWCSADRGKAWDEWMQKRVKPTVKPACKDPIAQIEKIGNKLNINNTPTIIFADGGIVPGTVPAAQLEKLLNDTPPK